MQSDMNDQELGAKLRAELDHRTESTDAVTAARLSAARARALDAVSGSGLHAVWMYTGAIATTLLVAVLVVWSPRGNHDIGLPLEEMELFSANEELEFYSELEFYEWLDYDQETG